jgi:hypothetical protein
MGSPQGHAMSDAAKGSCVIPLDPPFSGYWDYKESIEVPQPPQLHLLMKSGHLSGNIWLREKRYQLREDRTGGAVSYRYVEMPEETLLNQPEDYQLLTQSTLGINGRFGNQIFQYAFQRILARHRKMAIQTAPWIGQELFGHRDPPVTALSLPICAEGRDFAEAIYPAALFAGGPPRFDIYGFFQYHSSHYAPHRDFFRSLFRPVPSVEEPLQRALQTLRQRGKTVVGLHLRRGDFGHGPFFIAPPEWYLQFLRQIWPTLADPVLFIASDEPEKVVGDFSEFKPVTAIDLGAQLPQAPFYPDFYLLSQCDALGISNSTYSFAAAMLNERAKDFRRPDLYLKRLVPFDPWNSLPLLHRELITPLAELIASQKNLTPKS